MSSITSNEIYRNIGFILKTFRLNKNLTQEQLSEQLGISLKYISRIETGNNGIKTQTLINYMNLLGVTPNELFKNLITSEDLRLDIEISQKVAKLPESKKEFVKSFIDLLDNV